jgi:hypothetical protein
MSTHSDKIDELAKALTAAQAKLKPAVKDAVNPHFRSKYADLGAVTDAARPVLAANGLCYAQTFGDSNGETVTICTTLMHTSGQWIRSALTLKPTKPDPQGIGSAITYGRRYGLAAILGIVADDDDDGNGASRREDELPVSLPAAWDKWTLQDRGLNRANAGSEALRHWWEQLSIADKKTLKDSLPEWKEIAAKVPATT